MQNETGPRPQITEFQDYRAYLKAMYEFLRSRRPQSYQSIAKRIGASPSYFKNLLERRRHISIDRIFDVAKVFKVEPEEQDFFFILVLKDLTKNETFRLRLSEILRSLSWVIGSAKPLYESVHDQAGFLISRDWLAATIHELSRFKNAEANASWVLKQLIDHQNVSRETLTEIMTKLEELELIKIEGSKMSSRRDIDQYADPFSAENSLRIFQSGSEKVHQVLSDAPAYRPCRFFYATLAFDQAGQELALQEFDLYQKRIGEIAKACNNPDRVLYLSNNHFTLTRPTSSTDFRL